MKGSLFAAAGTIVGAVGVLLIMVTWGDCASWLTDYLDDNVASALRPTAESFGMSTGDLFSSPSGECRKWWADLSWVIGAVFVVIGTVLLASGGMKTIRTLRRSSGGFQSQP